MNITIPHRFTPREYQLPLLQAFERGIKRGVVVGHRRMGKDKVGLNLMIKEMVRRKGMYFYILPTYTQARKVIWYGIDGSGFKMLDHFPKEIVTKKNDQDMLIELCNGSIFQLIGGDVISESVVGTNPVGCVFSEYALQDETGWNLIRPILVENGGWALFLSTPRARNHLYRLLEMAKKNPEWFWQVLTIDDTKVMTKEQVDAEIASGMPEELALQEYFCSFDSSIRGAYYKDQLQDMKDQKRICKVPYDPKIPVQTAWDLGMHDATAILYFQQYGKEVRIIAADEFEGESIQFYATLLQKKGYNYGTHHFPHDISVRELGTGKSRLETFLELGLKDYKIAPKLPVEEGINAVRTIFPRLYIHEDVQGLIDALSQYTKKWDDKRQMYHSKPHHDHTSHYADAIRVLATSVEEPQQKTGWRRLNFNRDPYEI